LTGGFYGSLTLSVYTKNRMSRISSTSRITNNVMKNYREPERRERGAGEVANVPSNVVWCIVVSVVHSHSAADTCSP
jgi:hypothetical protein